MLPEQLKLKEFEQALLDDLFWVQVCGLEFNEVHLLNIWGPHFCKDFIQVGFMNACLNNTHCYGFSRVWGQMYRFLKYKMGNIEGLMNPQNTKILSDLPN